ncbi:MAG: hypothetical protein J6R14_03765 [Bacteroidales bacterium]|nr:hypothetical protein [Bacteroidales bacterium]
MIGIRNNTTKYHAKDVITGKGTEGANQDGALFSMTATTQSNQIQQTK